MEKVVCTILSCCAYNKNLDQFESIGKPFMDDPYKTLEDLYMNDILDRFGTRYNVGETDRIIDRVTSLIKCNKTIR